MRQEKQLLLDEIKDYIENNPTFLMMSYGPLKADAAYRFRGEIYESGGFVEIVRKRIFIKAAQEAGISINLDELPGHIGLIFGGKDPLETVKQTYKFRKENDDAIEVLGGRFDGRMYNAAESEQLSKLPGEKEMKAQLLGVLAAPMTQTLGVMQSLLTSVMYCLDNKAKQKS